MHLKTLTPERQVSESGYRFYSPALGRWLSRDPIEERGGPNLLSFVDNSPIVYFDVLGEAITSVSAGLLTQAGAGNTAVPSDAAMKAELVAFALTRWQKGPCCATKIDYVPRHKASRFRAEDDKPYQIVVAHTILLSGAPVGYDYSVCKIEQAVISALTYENVLLELKKRKPDQGLGSGVQSNGRAPVLPSLFDAWIQRTNIPFELKTFGIVYITNAKLIGPLIGNPVFSGQPHDVQKVTGNSPDYPDTGDAGVVTVGAW